MVKCFFVYIFLVECNVQLRFYFTCRALCDGKKLAEFTSAITFKALGNIRHHRCTGSLYLITKPEVF